MPSKAVRTRPDAPRAGGSVVAGAETKRAQECPCGCGRAFRPIKHQVYFETACRRRAYNQRHAAPSAISELKRDHKDLDRRLRIVEAAILNKGESL